MLGSDSLYHQLFSHPRMVEELVCEFVPEALAAGLDFSGLQRVNAKFHVACRGAVRREGDVIWRLPIRESVGGFLYLLIEFQSTRDWWMAVRTQVYQGLLWQQVINENELKSEAQLPPLLLLVLYNGKRRWQAPTRVDGLIGLSRESVLWPWQPRVRYYLLDMGRASREIDRVPPFSLATLLLCFEQRNAPEKLAELIDNVLGWFHQHDGYEGLQRLFTELVRRALQNIGMPVPPSAELLEMKSMMIPGQAWKSWKREMVAKARKKARAAGRAEGLAEGRAEGRVEGRVEGVAQGKAEVLLRILSKRFGPLPSAFQMKVQTADTERLAVWCDLALDAPDLSGVFDPR